MVYSFGSFVFDPDTAGLLDSGQPVALEPQVFSLLKYLIENRGRIVSKDELIDEIWQGRAITDSALNTRIRAVRRALGDNRTQQSFLRTYPKRGFQFVAKTDCPQSDDKGDATIEASGASSRGRVAAWAGAAVLFVVILGAAAWWLGKGEAVSTTLLLPSKPSIAVLRFENLSGNDNDQYFVDGLTEDIIINLSQYRELFVISRNTMFSYRPEGISAGQLASDLGVAFVARGSVQRDGGRVRINSELIDAQSGSTIWAERFDRNLTDIFALQDEISQAIAGRLAPEIAQARVDQSRETPTEDLDAWDLYLRARSAQAGLTREGQEEAIRLAGLAIRRDPELAAAHSLIARAKGALFFWRWSDRPDETLQEAINDAQTAIRLDDRDPVAYATLGYIYRFTGDATKAIANLERAARLNPNDATIRLELAHTLDWFRLQDRALPEINQAIRLSPRDPLLQSMYFYKAHILFHLRRFEDSLEAAREMSTVLSSDTWTAFYHMIRAANLAELGRADEAQQAISAALAVKPGLSLTSEKQRFEGSKNHPENRRIWLDSLQKAGLPE